MTDKSHVSVAQHQCPVCLKMHDVGVLLHKQLKPELAPVTFQGHSMCPEHEKLRSEGYIFLVVVNNNITEDVDTLKGSEARYTGMYVALKAEVAADMFGDHPIGPINYIDIAMYNEIKAVSERCTKKDK